MKMKYSKISGVKYKNKIFPFLLLSFIFIMLITSCNLIPGYNHLGSSTLSMKLRAEGTVNDEGMKSCIVIIKNRLTTYGVPEDDITISYDLGEISLNLKNVDNPERLSLLVSTTGKLEFWTTWDIKDVYAQLEAANTKLREFYKKGDTLLNNIIDKNTLSLKESPDTASLVGKLKNKDVEANMAFEKYALENPLFAYLKPNIQQGVDGKYSLGTGPNVGYCSISDTSIVNKMISTAIDSNLFRNDIKFLWVAQAFDEEKTMLWLIAIYMDDDGSPALDGSNVTDAKQDFDPAGNIVISMSMNSYGANIWKKITKKNIGKCIAIVLDDYVYSYPKVEGEIPNGHSLISGNFTKEEAEDLATILTLGKLPYKLDILSSETNDK
jgi:SecD/SecF fusion protein